MPIQWSIEDDYDAEFRYDRDPVGTLQGLAPDRVALIGTVSKSLAPTLRLGWIVCPPSIVEGVAEAKELDHAVAAAAVSGRSVRLRSATCAPAAEIIRPTSSSASGT